MRITFPLATLLTLCILASAANAQSATTPSLRDTIIALDQQLFGAFNRCDLATFNQYLAEDVEFYQDNDDVTLSRAQLEPSFKDRCRVGNKSKLRRELVLESVQVHPIQGYGAVQMGAHEFWIVDEGAADVLGATPEFIHLWRYLEGKWQITRVISYGH